MLNSVRNSDSGNLSLLEETVCDKFFCSSEFEAGVKSLQKKSPSLNVFAIPTFEEMSNGAGTHYPYNKPWFESHEDPILICHTSGSTGKYLSTLKVHGYILIAVPFYRKSKANRSDKWILLII